MTKKGEKRMTIYEIKRRVAEAGDPYFFARRTMQFFGQTLRDFSVKKIAPNEYLISAPIRGEGGKVIANIKTRRIFNAKTNKLERVIE